MDYSGGVTAIHKYKKCRNLESNMIILMIMYTITIIMGYIFKNSKAVMCFQCVLLSVLIGGYNGDGDLDNYRVRYQNTYKFEISSENLYDGLAHIFFRTKIPFCMFHLVIVGICVIMLALVVNELTHKGAFVLSCFMLWPAPILAQQFQQLISLSIIAVAFSCLLNNKKNIKYIFLCILSTGFHLSGIFYLIHLVIKYFDKKKLLKMVKLFLCIFSASEVVLSSILVYVLPSAIYRDYIISEHYRLATWKCIGMMVWQLAMTAPVFVVREENVLRENHVETIKKIAILQQMILVIYFITQITSRLMYVMVILIGTAVCTEKGLRGRLLRGYTVLLSLASNVFFLLMPHGKTHSMIYEVFGHNLWF